MKIQFCGATTGVTGSCHLIKTDNHNVLLDCGQFQGGKAQDAMNREPFPFDPKSVECMLLSHAHIDHCGRIPLLVKRGFKGDIYCTDATADLLDIMLKDSAYIHEKEAEKNGDELNQVVKYPREVEFKDSLLQPGEDKGIRKGRADPGASHLYERGLQSPGAGRSGRGGQAA